MSERERNVKIYVLCYDPVHTECCIIYHVMNGTPSPDDYYPFVDETYRKKIEVDGNVFVAEMDDCLSFLSFARTHTHVLCSYMLLFLTLMYSWLWCYDGSCW